MTPPPGYVGYGASGSYSPFSKIRGLAKALVAVEIAVVIATVIVLAVQLSLVGSAGDANDGVIGIEAFEDDLGTFVLVALLSGLIGIASLVLLIIWSYRIAGNLRRAGRQITWQPGLTIVVWILGGCTFNIINFLMLREHWKGSDPTVPPHSSGWQQSPVSPLIPTWFGLGIAQIVLGFMSGLRSFGGIGVGNNDAEDVAESLGDRLPFVLASGLLGIASAAILVVIIRQMTERHLQLTQEA